MPCHSHNNSNDLALIESDGILYFARYDTNDEPTDKPSSAVVKLITGIYDKAPEGAFRILRNRIYCSARLTPMCWGMVKVAARRIEQQVSNQVLEERIASIDRNNLVEVHDEFKTSEQPPLLAKLSEVDLHDPTQAMGFTESLTKVVVRAGPLYKCDRPIAAILVSAEGSLLGAAVNSNASNKTQHAEVNLVRQFWHNFRRKIPSNSTLYTTRKPCRMCAGMIWQCCEDVHKIKVIYREFDPGPNARATILNSKSPDRIKDAASLHIEMEEQFQG